MTDAIVTAVVDERVGNDEGVGNSAYLGDVGAARGPGTVRAGQRGRAEWWIDRSPPVRSLRRPVLHRRPAGRPGPGPGTGTEVVVVAPGWADVPGARGGTGEGRAR